MLQNLPLLNMLLALLVTLALMLGLALLLRKLNPAAALPRNGGRLKRVETLVLTPQHRLHLVEVDGTEHLIVTAPEGAVEINNKK